MTLAAALLLALTLQTPGERAGDSPERPTPTDTVPLPTDSYADSAAATLMARTRSYADSTKSGIEAYRMQSRYSASVGLSTGRRDRLLYKREVAWNVSWRRDVEWRVDILGSREVLPLVRNDPSVGDLDDEIDTLDPEFIIGNRGQWILRLPANGDSNNLLHPLADESERHYKFATGDTTRIQFPDGASVTLIEMKVIPRRSSSRLLSGSYWFDAASGAPVRAAFRLASPARIDMDIDGSASWLLPDFSKASFDLDYLTLEYALWQGRWWLPRLLSLQGRGSFGGVALPLLIEQTFEDIELFAEDDPWSPLPPPDTTILRPALQDQQEDDDDASTDDAELPVAEDAGEDRSARTPEAADTVAGLPKEIWVLRTDSALVSSPLLPASAFEIGSALSNLDMDRVRAALEGSIPPDVLAKPEIAWSPFDPGSSATTAWRVSHSAPV